MGDGDGRQRSVLIVEDNRQNLELAEFLLEEAGLRVRTASDARQARAELERELPDLVLMDMQLPGTDGLELVAELRRDTRFRALPIVALTAHALRGDRERFLAGGCDGYIPKPIEVSTFAQQVETVMRARGPAGEGR
ncbi:MAG TPA: response regulator [Thermoanaerobaculia bacterium]|jgi:CheY-like chemotaxis protein|nr:response regulator [Thermoanaerobaculia bacterium]